MEWRVLIELTGANGAFGLTRWSRAVAGPFDPLADSPIGLTLAEGSRAW
jgi:hypothetical protein